MIFVASISTQSGHAANWKWYSSADQPYYGIWNEPGSVFEVVTGARSDIEKVDEGKIDEIPGDFVNNDVYDSPDNKF